MLTSIRSLVFDFGGVLINWDPHRLFDKYFDNDPAATDRFMKEINFVEWNLSQDKGYPFAQAVLDLSAQFPQYASLIHAYDVEWEESITGINPETVDILRKLKQSPYDLYGLTNWSAEKFSIVRHKYDFFNYFDAIVVSGEVKLIKPDPAIFNLLLRKVDRKPEECLLIDDSPKNIVSAQALGFSTVQFTSPAQLEADLHRFGILTP
ncbi:MAG TPA: HAD family phosphatase [Anaerolineales bacterium]|nr:HAD family phosphatase [Anaerolineales bacterium]